MDEYGALADPGNVPWRRLSSLYGLDALIAAPEAVQDALRTLWALLVEGDPELLERRAEWVRRNTPPA